MTALKIRRSKRLGKSTKDIEKIEYEKLVESLKTSNLIDDDVIKGFTKRRPGGRRFVLSYNSEEN